MDQKLSALESEVQRLNNVISTLQFKFLELEKTVKALSGRAPAKQSGIGVPVWDAYRAAYMRRYKNEPLRNAKVNRNCLDIAKRIGKDAPAVVEFYVVRTNDPGWVRLAHPLGILLANCESVYSMWKQGAMTSLTAARRAEQTGGNVDASRKFLDKKYGRNE